MNRVRIVVLPVQPYAGFGGIKHAGRASVDDPADDDQVGARSIDDD